MATATTSAEEAKATSLPFVSESAWWQLRKLFQDKGVPRTFNADWVMTAGLRDSEASAGNLVRPFKRFGLFTSEGKPNQMAYDWEQDETYHDVCQAILHDIYPDTLTGLYITGDEEDRTAVVKWLVRNLHLAPASARQYAAFYGLLARGDPSEQDAGPSGQLAKSSKPAKSAASANGKRRATRTRATAAPVTPAQPTVLAMPITSEQTTQESAHSEPTRVHQPRTRLEPMVNINVQVHISADATADQIDQIFESMAKRLWQQDSGSHE